MDRLFPEPFAPAEEAVMREERARDSLMLMAQLRLAPDADPISVRVRNLSPGGLMAEVTTDLDCGTPIQIEVRGLGWVSGRIAWFTEGRTGIAFDREIDPKRARKPVSAAPGPIKAR